MTKGLILPADMKKHDELSDLKVLRSAAKSIVLVSSPFFYVKLFARFLRGFSSTNDLIGFQAAQKNYLGHDRMIKVWQSLRDAISENAAQQGEIAKLKAAQEAVVAERDTLLQKVDRASEEKQRAVKSTKARYLAELRKLRDAHKEVRDKAVEEAEDRGYKLGENTYERLDQAT